MPIIPIVENPRRRHRRRHLSAKQIAYGFGGKRRNARRRTRRRNPALATLSGLANPRRRRYRHSAAPRRHYRRYRNPRMLGGIGSLIDVKAVAYVTGGVFLSKVGPRLLAKVWTGAPTSGPMLYLVKAGVTLAGAMVVKKVFKSDSGAKLVVVGGLAEIAYGLLNDYALPAMGLAGIGNEYVSTYDLQQLQGYVAQPNRLAGAGMSVVSDPALSY